MRNRRTLISLATIAALSVAALAWWARSPEPPQVIGKASNLKSILAAAAPGDVLFKDAAGGFWGNAARSFSSNDDGYGHVGIIAKNPAGALVVIHAGGDPVSRNGRVRIDPINQFLQRVNAAALYRPTIEQNELSAMLTYARAAAARAAPFDRTFSLASEEALYCTELVWRALSIALKRDAVPDKSARAGRVYIGLDDLQHSPFVALIALAPAGGADL